MEFEDLFRIRATSSSAADGLYVLKDGELFAIFDRFGDVQSAGSGSQGLYFGCTRHLSRLGLLLEGRPPLLLSSTIRLDNSAMAVDLTNPDIEREGSPRLLSDTLHICRTKVLSGESYWEEISLQNHGADTCTVTLSLVFDCDYSDVFEVRGMRRARSGERRDADLTRDGVMHAYMGLDGALRKTTLRFHSSPSTLTSKRADFLLSIEPKGKRTVTVSVLCESDDAGHPTPLARSFGDAIERVSKRLQVSRSGCAKISTTNELFNQWLGRSFTDLQMLTTHTPDGDYPYAGIPWFSAPFGRDGLIVALECLWWCPELARGVLSYLAARQATEVDPEHDAEPGKILHERRLGEMASLGEVPFGEYYGSIDSTLLFLHLAGAYLERSADSAFIERLWPSIECALQWIRDYGDLDGDGYVEYRRMSSSGLAHQGWKDSSDSVFHVDGSDAQAPIALCEVQGYTYAALLGAAYVAQSLGKPDLAARLMLQATHLKRRFDDDFWSDDLGTYVLALDRDKRPCRVRTSNAGQCLWTGIVAEERVDPLIRTLMSEPCYSGWGFRTLAKGETRYNPLAYHNGSVWPHDTALIGYGMSRHGRTKEAAKVLADLFDAAAHFPLQRLPEVFCGLTRGPSTGPVRYPVACLPQAWAAGAVFLLLQAVLGLKVDARQNLVTLERPTLPSSLRSVHVTGLQWRESRIGVSFIRHSGDVVVELDDRTEGAQVMILK